MKRLIPLGLGTLLLAGTAAGTRSAEIGDALDFILFGPVTGQWMCLVGEPKDLHSLQTTADAIIRVRLGSRVRPGLMSDAEETWDFRDATVLDTFKTIGTEPAAGARIALVEWRGWTYDEFQRSTASTRPSFRGDHEFSERLGPDRVGVALSIVATPGRSQENA